MSGIAVLDLTGHADTMVDLADLDRVDGCRLRRHGCAHAGCPVARR